MCGIAGFQGDLPGELLRSMSETIAHRGPDGAGEWLSASEQRTGFAHRRLAIIDLSAEGAQPMTVGCPRCRAHSLEDLAITYNGELYNYRELRVELEGRGHVFHSRTDTEVLLHLYAEYGAEMLSRLNGIFAFALRDGRAEGRPHNVERGDVLLVRDPLGVKPLYYTQLPRAVAFASELKALLRVPGVERTIDPIALHHYMAYLWVPAPRTMVSGIRKLEPGHAAWLRDGRVHNSWSYYDLPYGGALLNESEADIAERLRHEVDAAIERQMVADVEVGAFLSGGMDSSAIVAAMRRIAPESRLRCYSIGFAGGAALDGVPPDLPYAKMVARHFGADLVPIEIGTDVVSRLEQLLYHLDEPEADPAPLNSLIIAEHARQDGIKVLLSGTGADDIFSGYRRHQAQTFDAYWKYVPNGLRVQLATGARRIPSVHNALVRRAVKVLEHVDLTGDARTASYFWWGNDPMRRALYSNEFTATLGDARTEAPMLASLSRIPEERDPLNRMLYLEAKHFLADHNLNYTDKTGMAAGVEVRVPLIDVELVRFAASIPPHMKQKGTTTKAILRRALAPVLPEAVLKRRKSGFGVPIRQWLRHELRPYVDELLQPQVLEKRGYFSGDAVQRLIEADRAGRTDASYTIYALICLELWSRMFLDN